MIKFVLLILGCGLILVVSLKYHLEKQAEFDRIDNNWSISKNYDSSSMTNNENKEDSE